MKSSILLLLVLLWLTAGVEAQILPAEKLLPNDTLLVLTAPDGARVQDIFSKSPQKKLWDDPAMKPFRDHFMKKFTADLIEPLEKELGFRLSEFKTFAQGQVTFAITRNGWQGKPDQKVGMILLVDARTKSPELTTHLAALKTKWLASGKEMKTEKIRDVEFTTLVADHDDLSKALQKLVPTTHDDNGAASKAQEKTNKKFTMTLGQSDSLLLIGNSPQLIEKILTKQAGGLVPSLSEDAIYEANHNTLFRDAHIYAWINVKPLLELWKSSLSENDPTALMTPKMFSALGLNGLKTMAATYNHTSDGGLIKFFVGAPEGSRQGLARMLVAETKDSAPPPFVPADAVKFSRWRLDLQKAFTGFEAMMSDINPSMTGLIKFVLESAGKDQDPEFDLRKELIGNLGDDLITYEKKPRSSSLDDLDSPPSLFLLSSSNPEKLAHAIKLGLASLGPEASSVKDRDFIGRKVYSFATPPMGGPNGTRPKSLHFAAGGGYVGLSTDIGILEEYLRSNEFKGKTLAETSGLHNAAEKVGGLGTGLFSYENQNEVARVTVDSLKKNSGNLASLFGASGVGAALGISDNKNLQDWADFALLPPFDAITKYFYFSVYAGSADATGFTLRMFSPTPPASNQ